MTTVLNARFMLLRRISTVVLVMIATAVPAWAQPGEVTGFAFMRVEQSARAAALGGSLSAVCCEDLGAFFQNPALLTPDVNGMLFASYLNHLHDLSAGFAAYGRDFGRLGTAAVGLRYMHYGDLERTNETGQVTGSFSASDMVFTLGLGRPYQGPVRIGANVHLVHSRVDHYSATALLFDAGLVYHEAARGFTAGASVNNLGVVLNSLGNVADETPLDLRVGVAKRLRYVPLHATLTAYKLNDIGRGSDDGGTASDIASHLIIGLEFQVIAAFAIRLGYNHRRHRNLSSGSRLDIAGAGTGFGLKIRGFMLDYAYSSWSFAGLHQFTIGARL